MREQFADRCRSGERDLVDLRMIDNRLPGFTGAGDNVDDTVGKFGRLKNLREVYRGDARGFGRLEYAGISACQRRSELPRRH